MNGFLLRPLDELADFNPKVNLKKGVDYPFVAMEDLTPGMRYARSKQQRQLAGGARFQGGDTLFARITPCLENGKISQYDPDAQLGFGSTEFIVLRAKAHVADPAYIYYLSLSEDVRNSAIGSMSGASGRQRANINVISKSLVPSPNLSTQRRIAFILGAYDDLIETNRRRITVMEKMAQGLFEEWFVRFRFPGYQKVSIHDTSYGLRPLGWDWKSIGEVTAYVNRGIAPKYNDKSATLVIGQKCIRDQRLSLVLARRQSKKVPLEKIVQPGDILINSTGTGTLGRVAQAEQVPQGLSVDSHVTIVRPILSEDRDYLGLSLFAMQPVFERLGTGSTNQTELARSAVQNQMLIWPPTDFRANFGRIVRPMRKLIEQLSQQNACLATSRDLLLPRLISGQLSVVEAERCLGKAA